LTEESKTAVVADEPVAKLLELQARYGMDQETMLIYVNSVNLMSILSLISRRHSGGIPASVPALPPLPAPGAAPGGGPTMEQMMGAVMKMLGGQGGGAPGGAGINPAMLTSLLSALGQNVDLGNLMSMLAGMMGAGGKPTPKTTPGVVPQVATAVESGPPGRDAGDGGGARKTGGEGTAAKREAPKIMKWDQLDEHKKA